MWRCRSCDLSSAEILGCTLIDNTSVRKSPISSTSTATAQLYINSRFTTYTQNAAPHGTGDESPLRETRHVLRKGHIKPHRRPLRRLRSQCLPRTGMLPTSTKASPGFLMEARLEMIHKGRAVNRDIHASTSNIFNFNIKSTQTNNSPRAHESTTSANPSPTSPRPSRATTSSRWACV